MLVGEVRGLDQLAGDRGVGLVKGLPMELLMVGVKRALIQENATTRSLGKRHSHETEPYESAISVSILNSHALPTSLASSFMPSPALFSITPFSFERVSCTLDQPCSVNCLSI